MTNTLFVGKVYHHFNELPSTNDQAAELLSKSKPPEGTALRADTQTAGRGQFGSRWVSPAGQNLLMSIILYPNWLPVKDQFFLSMAVSLALHDAIDHPDCRVKWPNDLYLGTQKTGGVLIQNSIGGTNLQSSIVGIGLNVNQLAFDPALPNPVSLAAFFGKPFDLDELMQRIFACLEHRYLQLKSGRLQEIREAYENLLFRRDERSRFFKTASEETFEGIIRGVADSGHLKVETEGGMQLFDLKEIRIIL